MRQLKPKIAHFIRFNLAKFKFRYLVRYRYYILPFVLVLITVALTTLAITTPSIQSYLTNGSSANTLLSSSVLTISLSVLLTIGTSLYFWIDYRQHNAPLKQADPKVRYSFKHHLKVVTFPLLRFKWKPLAYAFATSTLTLLALVGTLYMSVRNVQASATNEIVINKTNENIGYFKLAIDGTKTYIPNSRTSKNNPYGPSFYDKISPSGAKIASLGTLDKPGIQIINTDGTGVFTINPSPYTDGITIAGWHPDEQKILFIMSNDIFVADLNTSTISNLTNDNTTSRYSAEWSPDGAKILYRQATSYRIMNPDGSGKLTVPNIFAPGSGVGSQPKWSPDSTKIAQFSGTSMMINTVSSNVTNTYALGGSITTTIVSQYEWLSNTQLAFLGRISTRDQLFTINSDNTSRSQKTSDSSGTVTRSNLSVSPDKTRITYSTTTNVSRISLYNLQNSTITTTFRAGGAYTFVQWSKDSQRYLACESFFIWSCTETYTRDGATEPDNINSSDVPELRYAFGWDSDNKIISKYPGPPNGVSYDSSTLDLQTQDSTHFGDTGIGNEVMFVDKTRNLRIVQNSPGYATGSWKTADNLNLAIVLGGFYEQTIGIMPGTPYGDSKLFLDYNQSSGELLFKYIDTNYVASLYIVDLDNMSQRLLVNCNDWIIGCNAKFSHDGQQVLFSNIRDTYAEEANFLSDVYVINTDGTNKRNLTDTIDTQEEVSFSPGGGQLWSGDDSNVLITKENGLSLLVLNVETGSQQVIEQNLGNPYYNELTLIDKLAFSPDGSKIAYTIATSNDSRRKIVISDSDGLNKTEMPDSADIFALDSYFSWKSDGSSLIVSSYDERGAWLGQMDISDGTIDMIVAPDGKAHIRSARVEGSAIPPQNINISNCQELQNMNLGLNNIYKLTNDIDCSDTINWNNGQGFIPVGEYPNADYGGVPFTGSLDGQGYKIINLYQGKGQAFVPVGTRGIFGVTMGATITNLTIENLNYELSDPDAYAMYAGGLIGYAMATSVNKVNTSGTITGSTVQNSSSGGVVGVMLDDKNATSSQLSSYVNISQESSGATTVGGLYGSIYGLNGVNITINDSFTRGDITLNHLTDESSLNAGGLVGASMGNLYVNRAYAAGTITDNTSVLTDFTVYRLGGLVGGMSTYNGWYWPPEQVTNWINQSFSAMTITSNNVNPVKKGSAIGLLAIIYDPEIQVFNTIYYDNNLNGEDIKCVGGWIFPDIQPGEDVSCNLVNISNSQPNYFKNNSSNAPLDQWDFTTIWKANENDYPTFIPQETPVAQDPFILNVKTDNPGGSASNEFIISANTNDYTYDYNVDCNNDGTPEYTNQTGDVVCTYGVPGEYDIAISGTFPHFYGGSGGDQQKILDVKQWGDIAWQDMSGMFGDAINMQITASDTPNLSNVTNISRMFNGATSFNSDINGWDVSTITNMNSLFLGATTFNQPLNNWVVNNVTDMSAMFDSASSFNADISTWNVTNVTNMSGMFDSATTFNQPLNNWVVNNVTDMSAMFDSASSFNADISTWNVTNVTNMSGMFWDTLEFNQPLNSWNVSNVISVDGMFGYAASFNQPLNNWDVNSVTDMHSMFYHAPSFNQPLSSWDVSNVTNMQSLFFASSAFDQPLNTWDVSNVTSMSGMFAGATSFDQPLNSWDVSNVTNMSGMFAGAEVFDRSLADWNVSNVADMTYMFGDANGSLGTTSGLSTTNYDATLIGWNNLTLQSAVTFDAGTSQYCSAEAERANISSIFSWTINDSGEDPNCNSDIGIPQNVSGTPNASSIEVEWDEVVNANRYELEYRINGDTNWTSISSNNYGNPIVGTLYEISGLSPETIYDIRVRALDNENKTSSWSDILTLSTLAIQTYHITDCQELQAIAIDPVTFEFGDATANYILDSDIDCTESANWTWDGLLPPEYDGGPIGFFGIMNLSSGQHFTGNFNGQGHTITGLFQNVDMVPAGLFTFASGSLIENVTLQDSTIIQNSSSPLISNTYGVAPLVSAGSDLMIRNSHAKGFTISVLNRAQSTSGLVGRDMGASSYPLKNDDTITIEYSSAEGGITINQEPEVTAYSSYMQKLVGGLFGGADVTNEDITASSRSTTISRSSSDVDITYNLSAIDQQELFVGGLAGALAQAQINNSYSSGDIIVDGNGASGKWFSVGGLVGFMTGSIDDSYSSGGVEISDYTVSEGLDELYASFVGGLVGWWYAFDNGETTNAANITNSFTASRMNVNGVTFGEGELFNNGLVGFAPEGDTTGLIINSYFDKTATGKEQCVSGYYFIAPEGTSCTSVNQANTQPNYFKNNTSNPPLNLWNFSSIWKTTCSYPTFVSQTNCSSPPTPTPTPPGTTTPPTTPRPKPRPTPTTTTTPPTTTSTTPATGGSSPGSPAVRDMQDSADREVLGQRTVGILPLPLYNFVHRVSDSAALSISWLLLLILLILATIYGWKAYTQYRANQRLVEALTRLRNTKQATDTYLQITNHYLNTPVAIMSGAIELLASLKKLPQTSIDHLQATVTKYKDAVTALAIDGEAAITDAPALSSPADSQPASTSYVANLLATVPQSGSALKNRAVYLPLAIVGGTFALVTFMFANAQVYQLSPVQLGLQLLCLLLAGILLATTYRQRDLQKATQAVTGAAITTEQQLISQRTSFIDRASKTLSDHFETLSITCRNLTTMPEAKTLLNGLAMLGDTTKSLTNVSRLSHLSPDAPLSNLVLDIPRLLMPLQPLATAKQLTLTTHIPPHLNVTIQPEELGQLIQSTVSNAIQFSPANSTVDITAKQQGKNILLTFTDHGPGIPSDKLDQLFQPFSRATETETYDHPGLGLNLHVNKLITEKLGGTIQLTSTTAPNSNTGTTVSIALPAAKTGTKVAPVMVVPQ